MRRERKSPAKRSTGVTGIPNVNLSSGRSRSSNMLKLDTVAKIAGGTQFQLGWEELFDDPPPVPSTQQVMELIICAGSRVTVLQIHDPSGSMNMNLIQAWKLSWLISSKTFPFPHVVVCLQELGHVGHLGSMCCVVPYSI